MIKKENSFFIISILFIFLGVTLILIKDSYDYYQNINEEKKIKIFLKEQEKVRPDNNILNKETNVTNDADNKDKVVNSNNDSSKTNYIAVIKIPEINLEKGLCRKESKCNNVNQNIKILKESDYPDINGGCLYLAGHSGTSRASYFKNLKKLTIGDEVSIIYNGKDYKYKVVNFYEIEKNGKANIVRNAEKTTLALITCYSDTKQIVYICELI